MTTIFFEDDGQDFLEWDVDENGLVIDSRPFQGAMWASGNLFLDLESLVVGGFPTFNRDGVAKFIKHRIERIVP